MWVIASLDEELLASKEGLCSIELMSKSQMYSTTKHLL